MEGNYTSTLLSEHLLNSQFVTFFFPNVIISLYRKVEMGEDTDDFNELNNQLIRLGLVLKQIPGKDLQKVPASFSSKIPGTVCLNV